MPADDPIRSSQPGGRIGKYEIIAEIGHGAMGRVYRARDTVLGRFVAIKTMSGAVLGDTELSQRFLREAQSAARLNHPNVVTLHEFGEDSGRVFMAMELLDGEDLKALLKHGGPPTFEEKLAIMEQVLDGVAYAHASGVIHRDLKPANIHVQTNGRVKVMDFGLARLGESEMTRAGTVMGTPNYMSPEQVRGERAGPYSDVFSLGAVFYELIGGRRAFDADSMHAILFKVTDSDPTPLSQFCPDTHTIIEVFLGKALAKDVGLRYPDGAAMREALDVCRQVLEGALDEEGALAALRQTPTIIQASGVGVRHADTTASGTPTLTGGASTRRGISGSLPVARTGASSVATVRKGSKLGSKPRLTPRPTTRSEAPGSASAASAALSRAPIYVALLAVAGLVVAAALLLNRRPQPAVTPPDDQKARALVGVAVEAQLEVARRNLELKDLEGAINAADKTLQVDPQNAEAQDIARRARALLDEVEAAAREARQAAAAGDTDAASKALARVLALMPKHPVADELSAQLDSRMKARADAASQEMKREAEAARRAGASSLRAYAEAAALSGRAEAAYARKQYTEAAQRFLEAQRAYQASRRDAEELAARPTPPPTTLPPPTTSTLAAAPPTSPPEPSLPPSTTPPPTPLRPTATPRSVISDEAAVRQVVASLERAIEGKDLVLYKKVRPGLTEADERRLRDAFQNVASEQVQYAIDSISIDGDTATLRVTRSGRVSGRSTPPIRQVLRLTRGDNGWVITDIGQ
jgi:serine/threonine-protein kinase